MTRHLMKLIWNRKRSNLLVMVEIFCSFVVVFFVVGLGLFYADNYRQPLGYSYADVWRITVQSDAPGPRPTVGDDGETGRQLLLALKDMPQVESAAIAFTSPYDGAGWSTDYDVDGRHFDYEINPVSDDFQKVLGLEMVRGRWFDQQDGAAPSLAPAIINRRIVGVKAIAGPAGRPPIESVVINERLARAFFGDEDPVGRLVPQDNDESGNPRSPKRIVGVVREFRQHGEFAAPGSYLFQRHDVATRDEAPRLLVVKVRPGTTATFEETLTRRLQDVAKTWSFKVQPLAELRAQDHRRRLAPLLAVGLVAGFLLLMVALGLTGVLWQNVTQRTREIGLRRAKGATARNIYAQVVGEILVMTTLALALAVVLVAQLPFLGFLSEVPARVLVASLAASIVALYGLAAVCALHPARLATRVQPAEALHYE